MERNILGSGDKSLKIKDIQEDYSNIKDIPKDLPELPSEYYPIFIEMDKNKLISLYTTELIDIGTFRIKYFMIVANVMLVFTRYSNSQDVEKTTYFLPKKCYYKIQQSKINNWRKNIKNNIASQKFVGLNTINKAFNHIQLLHDWSP
ncbi:hypothetical protein ACTA71_000726 [Dictyostelium dimigraforme]